MIVSQQGALELLNLESTVFTLPLYQRHYSWTKRQCKELWLDIFRAARSSNNHFSGTILCEDAGMDADGNRVFSIIDGQQRITTITLMLTALRNHLTQRSNAYAEGNLPSAHDIETLYLTLANDTPSADGARASKLNLAKADQPSLVRAIAGDAPTSLPSKRIAANLEYFEDFMQADDFDAHAFMNGLSRLQMIWAVLDSDDDAQAIFESLNSKGMQLNIGDMVRNYLLAAESHQRQAQLYDEYWTVIEGVFDPDPGSLRLDTMVKAWLSVRFPKVRARKPEDVYSAFKQYYDDEYAGDLEPVLAELRSFSMVWAENYRYHAVKKFKSMAWAINGPQTLTSGYELKKAANEEYAERERAKLKQMAMDDTNY